MTPVNDDAASSAQILTEQLQGGYRGRVALTEASLAISAGLTILVGRNGAGKTTLLRLLAGDLVPLSGSITVRDADGRQAALSSVGYLPQSPGLPHHFSASDLVRYAGAINGVPRSRLSTATRRTLEAVGLGDRETDQIGHLSGGMQQRTALAAVLVSDPLALLLDEPMNALDPVQRTSLAELLSELARTRPIVVATHVIDALAVNAQQIIVLSEGRVSMSGSPEQLCAPHRVTVESLTSSVVHSLMTGSRSAGETE